MACGGSEPAKKSGQTIPKNRCRTTVAERMMETLAELPFMGDQVSRAGESHPRALAEPDVRLSPHPAPIVQPRPCKSPQWANSHGVAAQRERANALFAADGVARERLCSIHGVPPVAG